MKKNILFVLSLLVATIAVPLSAAKELNLFTAVESKKFKVVKKIVEQGASLNLLNKDGKTALDIATEKNYGKICRYLLRNGAKVTNNHNACKLERNFTRRGVLMTVFGVFTGPFGLLGLGLILGGVFALADRSMIGVL